MKMRYRYFVGIPHQKVHYRFIHSVLGGEYVNYPCSEWEKTLSKEILNKDGEDVIWFFSDIYYHLHPQLKGKQILTKHGLCFGKWLTPQRAECINHHLDRVFQTGATQQRNYQKYQVIPEKIKEVGYTLLFEIPDKPTQPNAVLFSSTCFRHWNHYRNLEHILKNLDSEIEGHVSIHPQTPQDIKKRFLDICTKKTNLTFIQSQDELLQAFAHCAYNVSGGSSSVGSPFWFQNKPVIFIRGRVGLSPLKKIGWNRIKQNISEPLFSTILDESIKISNWKEFNARTLFKAKPAPSAAKVFYPWNKSAEDTKEKILQYVQELKEAPST